MEGRFGPIAAWRERHRTLVMVSGIGGADATKQDRAAWAEDLRQALPVLGRLCLPAALWAYTHGGWWRLQDGESARPHPVIAAALPPPPRTQRR